MPPNGTKRRKTQRQIDASGLSFAIRYNSQPITLPSACGTDNDNGETPRMKPGINRERMRGAVYRAGLP